MTKEKQETIRNPLGRARGLGSAKDGVHHWWMQRVTSAALLPLTIYLATQIRYLTTKDYPDFVKWMGNPFNAIVMLLFVVSSFYHAALGVQVIIEDYVHHKGCKFACLLLNKLFFLFFGFAAAYAVVKINFTL